jgi:uncharacterized LabA/DUF88 family protein
MATDEERIALFIDHENLVLGAREISRTFDIGPVMEALAERGRVVARRAYADWTLFADDRRSLVEHNCELIDIPQRTGAVRKNAADIKLAVDAMELAYERGFVSTFVIASGDSDFTPLVAALRALNRRVIGIGVKGSTSALLPPACDEFMFYDRLPGVSEAAPRNARAANGKARPTPQPQPEAAQKAGNGGRDLQDVQRMVTQTLAGLTQSGTEPVLASTLKRALLRKDPTFSESDYGFRAFGELLRQLERNGVLSLAVGQAPGDPAVDFPDAGQSAEAFDTLRTTVLELQGDDDEVPLSGLKDQIRKRVPNWSEKDLGYSGFLQFARAAAASGTVDMEWDDDEGDYFLYVPE